MRWLRNFSIGLDGTVCAKPLMPAGRRRSPKIDQGAAHSGRRQPNPTTASPRSLTSPA